MRKLDKRKLALLGLAVILVVGIVVNVRFWTVDTKGQDIYYSWVEGSRILAGENPYARILAGNMQENEKYATYFPVFYEFSSLSQLAGLRAYEQWITFWRVVFLVCNLVIACLVFVVPYRRRLFALAVFAAAFWMFNRWTVHISYVAHLDYVPLLLLLASLLLFERHRSTALLLFGLSLGIKQIAVFLVPLYLIWVWQAAARRHAVKQVMIAALLISCIPLISSLPFFAWNADSRALSGIEGFIKSIAFSATRLPADHFGAASVDGLLGWVGIPAKLPMLALMILVLWLAWRRQVGKNAAAFLVMLVFVDFNSVMFVQYVTWIVPLLLLVLCDYVDLRQRAAAAREEIGP